MVANICPMKPSGVQLASAMLPPGRQTRTSSSALRRWCGANITPIAESTWSNSLSSNGSDSASACRHARSRPSASARSPAGLEQLGREVARDDVGTGAGRDHGRAPRPGSHVQDAPAGTDGGCLDHGLPERGDQVGGDRGIVAERPHRPVTRLQLAVCSRVERVGALAHLDPFP